VAHARVPSVRPRPPYAGFGTLAVSLASLGASVALYLKPKASPGQHLLLYSGVAFVAFVVLLAVALVLVRRARPAPAPAPAPAADSRGELDSRGHDVDVLIPSPPVGVSDYAAESPQPVPPARPPVQDPGIQREAEDRDASRRGRRACPHCGALNPVDFELCESCHRPLTDGAGPT
jgi:hypothetical protein